MSFPSTQEKDTALFHTIRPGDADDQNVAVVT